MADLKPIGSEKLTGQEKLNRIMEIARYKEVPVSNVNETSTKEFSINLSDGIDYQIVKEKQGYIIKKTISESQTDYIEPMKNRKYFSSYSQALKKLNLMAKEFNSLYGNDEGMSLFTEQKKKFKLRLPGGKKTEETPAPELPPPPAAEPIPAPAPAPDMAATPPMGDEMGGELPPPPAGDEMGGELPAPPTDEMEPPTDEDMPEDEMDLPADEDMPEDEGDKKGPSLKTIQKLTGKLAQKIRSYNTKDEMDSNDVKYIVNSILSAIDVDVLDDDDLEEIIDRLEGNYEEDEDGDEDMDMEDEDMEEPQMPSDEEELPTPPEAPEGGEVAEYFGGEMSETMNLAQGINKSVASQYTSAMKNELPKGDMTEYGMHGARKPRHTYGDTGEFKHFTHGTFGESEVDKIISQYFNVNEDEIIKEEKQRITKLEKLEKQRELNKKNVRNLSESVAQERGALKFLENHPNYKLIGKTNKGNLVFKNGIVETKINLNGKPL